ncbi:MAG: CDP-glycerol glycerophosphotransferase family protein [Lachnospiraceae bacterium]|nr:CDP-glycerol glycerophosphotransferase family protein [Lachnospiraceae bacterium]
MGISWRNKAEVVQIEGKSYRADGILFSRVKCEQKEIKIFLADSLMIQQYGVYLYNRRGFRKLAEKEYCWDKDNNVLTFAIGNSLLDLYQGCFLDVAIVLTKGNKAYYLHYEQTPIEGGRIFGEQSVGVKTIGEKLELHTEEIKALWYFRRGTNNLRIWIEQKCKCVDDLQILIGDEFYEKCQLCFSAIDSVEDKLRIALRTDVEYKIDKIVLYDETTKDFIAVPNFKVETENSKVEFDIKQQLYRNYSGEINRYTLYFLDNQTKKAYGLLYFGEVSQEDDYNNINRLLLEEQAETVHLENGEEREVSVVWYLTQGQILRNMICARERVLYDFYSGHVSGMKFKEGVLSLKFSLENEGYEIQRVYAILRNALEPQEVDFTVHPIGRGKNLNYTAVLDVKKETLNQFYWDVRAVVQKGGNEYLIRLKNKEKWFHRRRYLQFLQYCFPDGNVVYPYKTKSGDIAMEYRMGTEYDNRKFVWEEYLAIVCYFLSKPFLKKRKIWLVYEKYCEMAQDNGYYFFKYCMENLPEKERQRIYYVIDKKSPDYQYVKPYDKQVIDFLSLKHRVYLLACQILVASDTKAHAYAWHSPRSVYRAALKRKKNAFLQHGVIMFKYCHRGLRKGSVNQSEMFIVSSDVEKQIVLDNFGYRDDQILVTGLARWDVLEDKSTKDERKVLLMPTWRKWLEEVQEDEFRNSEYYHRYMELLNDPKLAEMLEKQDIYLDFYMHPKFKEYIGTFSARSSRIRLIAFGEEPLNQLMMHCKMMITDYSSAVWDVFYQGKPVLFYLFDLEKYEQIEGTYIDMNTEAFGEVAHEKQGLIDLIEQYAIAGFQEKEEYAKRRGKLIKYIDADNSKRTYEMICEYLRKNRI